MTGDGDDQPRRTVAEIMDAILLEAATKFTGRSKDGRLRQLAVVLEMSSGGQIDILKRLHDLPGGTYG